MDPPAKDRNLERDIPKAKGRKARTAQMQVSWAKITCPAPADKKGPPVVLWLVKALELKPPKGEQAISWAYINHYCGRRSSYCLVDAQLLSPQVDDRALASGIETRFAD